MASTSSLDIVIGASWKWDENCLASLYSYRSGDDHYDFTTVRDIIDIIVDGANITSRLSEENIFYVMLDLLNGIVLLQQGRTHKHLISFPEGPWELAIENLEIEFSLSLYGVDSQREVLLHNRAVRKDRFIKGVAYAGEKLLEDLISLNSEFSNEPLIKSFIQQLRICRQLTGKKQNSGSALNHSQSRKEALLSHSEKDLALHLCIDTSHINFWSYQGGLTSDLHSLLFPGSLSLSAGDNNLLLAQKDYLFNVMVSLIDGIQELLEFLDTPSSSPLTLLSTSLGMPYQLTAEVKDNNSIELSGHDNLNSPLILCIDQSAFILSVIELTRKFADKLVGLNEKQGLNAHINELKTKADTIKRKFAGLCRGDIYFEKAGHLRKETPALPLVPQCSPPSKGMPVSFSKVKHLFYRSSWFFGRSKIQYEHITPVDGRLLIPSHQRLDTIDLESGALVWSENNISFLAATEEGVLSHRKGSCAYFNLKNGHVLWNQISPIQHPLASWTFSVEDMPYALILDEKTGIHCISLMDGGCCWTFSVEHGEILGCVLTDHVFCILGDDGFTYGLSLVTGNMLWKIHLKGHFVSPPAYHQGSLFLVADVEPGYNGFLYHIDPLTGKTRSCHQLPMSPAQAPYFVDSCAIVTLECPRQSLLWAMDITLDEPIWTIKIDSLQIDLPTLTWVPSVEEQDADGILVVKTDNGNCMGIDLNNGEILWRTPLLSQGEILTENLPPQRFEHRLLIPERYLSVLDPMTGEQLYRLDKLPEHVSYMYLIDGFKLILGRGDDQLESYAPRGYLALT